jgi:large subunit ribosomal protein L24
MKIKKGDTVYIKIGKDQGKTGKVEKTLPKLNKIVVKGLNIYKKHAKPTRGNPQGGIIDINVPINASNVQLVCPRCNKSTRVGYQISENTKIRTCKKCKESLDAKS